LAGDRFASSGRSPAGAGFRFLLGSLLAVGLFGGLAEAFLRLFPPLDLQPYMGEASPLTGGYAPDEDFGVTYRSWDVFCRENAERLEPYLPLEGHADSRPTWAFFGNSFVQAPGMLADHARATVADRRIFNLGRNELLFIRFAQIKLLLEHGLKPERLFVELMPVDLLSLGRQPLSTLQVTGRGALTYRPSLPGAPADAVVEESRLFLTAWIRSGRHHGNPRFNPQTLYQGIPEPLLGDVARLFANLARIARAHGVPVTVLLIPAYHQVLRRESFGFQDSLTALLAPMGYDVFDPRAAFCAYPDKPSLHLPDKHLTAEGNRLLLAELLAHVGWTGSAAQPSYSEVSQP
jgi:hypothetical protein